MDCDEDATSSSLPERLGALRSKAETLQAQLVSERTAVARVQRSRLADIRQAIDWQLAAYSAQGAHWLPRASAYLSQLPPHSLEALRERILAEAGLGSLSSRLASACTVSASAVIAEVEAERAECLANRSKLLGALDRMSEKPSDKEVLENGNCKRTKDNQSTQKPG